METNSKAWKRFWEKVHVNKVSNCWLWLGCRSEFGHGYFGLGGDGKMVLAHRFSWEWKNGQIPPGLHIDHLCMFPRCVNPDHLEPVTPSENSRRALRPVISNDEKTVCIKGHAFEGMNLKIDTRGYRVCLECERRRSREHEQRRTAARRARNGVSA